VKSNVGKIGLKSVVAVIILVVVSSILFALSYAEIRPPTGNASDVPDKIEAIPVPLGAYNVIYTRPDSNSDRGLSFDVRLPVDQVVDYYKREVRSQGWEQFQENRNIPNEISLYNVWNDKQDRMPYSLDLLVTISFLMHTLPTLGTPTTHVTIFLSRLPILDKTPIYPGAESVEIKHQTISGGDIGSVKETLITFRTYATAVQINDYYKSLLPQYGWNLSNHEAFDNATNSYISGSVLFNWNRGGPESTQSGAGVILKAEEHPGDETTVELHLRGTNRFEP
jgi:hypothetical protein